MLLMRFLLLQFDGNSITILLQFDGATTIRRHDRAAALRSDIDLNVRLKGPENARIRGNPYKIVVNQCRLNVRKNVFSERVAVAWNSLPPSVVKFFHLYEPSEEPVNANLK